MPLSLRPLRRYTAPAYPTHAVAMRHPELLRRLPARWRKKAAVLAVLAAAGLTAAVATSGQAAEKAKIAARLAPIFPQEQRPQIAGKIAAPKLITEADARAIIVEEAKKAGITFAPDALVIEKLSVPKEMTPNPSTNERKKIDLVLDGTDAKRKISYEYVSTDDIDAWRGKQEGACFSTRDVAVALHDSLAQSLPEGTTAIFYDDGPFAEDGQQESLRKQVREFITWLKAEGVI